MTLSIGFAMASSTANAWTDEVVDRTARALDNARCVSREAPDDTVHVLNFDAPPEIMSADDELTAILDLTDALSSRMRFRVTRGGALEYEAITRASTSAGSASLARTLEELSNSAATILLRPYQRTQSGVRVEVTLLIRDLSDGRTMLSCTPSFRVDIPASRSASPALQINTPPTTSPEAEIRDFVRQFHDAANGARCEDMGRFYASSVVVAGERRTRQDQIERRCAIERRNPFIRLYPETVRVRSTGRDRFEVQYENTSWIDARSGRRVVTDWRVTAEIERQFGALRYTRIDLTSRRR